MAQSFFLADDDDDDRLLFEDALRELSADTNLIMATDGVDLMEKLEETVPLPCVIFLDINMPRKNGFECLAEMRQIEKFRAIPVVIFSTSNEESTIERTYRQGASFYIHKPRTFDKLKSAIRQIMAIDWSLHTVQPSKEKYVLQF
ncbi:response regulator [Dawidia soli]|uniref:Response regulator n=1 Tax=Dawidia soli TaxID=2782352 RepID=A0AAP2DBJ6_9BACT|nr:response regulator [Dawidia soli]MBT1688076.1 response regulator [Dawidia soli]